MFARLGIRLDFVRGEFTPLLDGVRTGDVDVLLGAVRSQERDAFARFSAPYRRLESWLYLSNLARDMAG